MNFSAYSDKELLRWAETLELRADVDLEEMPEKKKDLFYFVAEQIYGELVTRELLK